MANTYLKLFVDCLEKYKKLNDTEFGRLVRTALRYKATGEEADNMGREALLWDGMKLDIDRDNIAYAKTVKARSEAGKMGGRPKNEEKQKKQMLFQESKKSQEEEKEEEKDKDILSPHMPPFGENLSASVSDWLAYKRERNERYKPQGLKCLFTEIKNNADRHTEDAVAEVIRASMASGYKGIVFDRLGKGGLSKKPQYQSHEQPLSDFAKRAVQKMMEEPIMEEEKR